MASAEDWSALILDLSLAGRSGLEVLLAPLF
jgi:hypothetical protein